MGIKRSGEQREVGRFWWRRREVGFFLRKGESRSSKFLGSVFLFLVLYFQIVTSCSVFLVSITVWLVVAELNVWFIVLKCSVNLLLVISLKGLIEV